MRFVRHAGKVEWGLGVVASEDATNLDILFEGVGHKKMAKTFTSLVEVSEADVPARHPLRNKDGWPKVERVGKRAQATRDLPKRFDGFIQEFLAQFPTGLNSPECDEEERTYKLEAGVFARKELEPGLLKKLLEEESYEDIIKRAKRVLSQTNLAFPNELTKFGDIPKTSHENVARRIVTLVSAGEQTPEALQALAEALRPHLAAKWTICSLIPFLLDPEKWPFVKPTFIERAVEATGIDVEYEAMPSAKTYRLIRDLYAKVFVILQERGLEPRDAIDVQTFLWVASGMAREMHEAQARKADAKAERAEGKA